MQILKEKLFEAYYIARKNKRNTINQLKFELNYEEKLFQLYNDISTHSYKVGKSIAFIVNKPVKREIFAAEFRDRVVHHLIFNYINPILEPQFIDDSYSCRKGKGTHYGVKKAYQYIQEATDNYTKDAYVLKLDIQGYFMGINKNILYEKLCKMIPEEKFIEHQKITTKGKTDEDIDYKTLLILLKEILFHNPVNHCIIKGNKNDWAGLPDSKSLFKAKENCGLPIGNLTSQLFSNVYLADFDRYMKKDKKMKFYGRYVDDFFVVATSKEQLKQVIKHSRRFIEDNEALKIHPKKIYLQHASKGIAFLGAYIKYNRIYIGRRTQKAFESKITLLSETLKKTSKKLTNSEISLVRATINSYLGVLKHYKTYNIRKKILMAELTKIFYKLGYFACNINKYIIKEQAICY